MLVYSTYATPRADLGAAMQEFRDSQITYIGLRILPILRVKKDAGTVSAVIRESTLGRVDTKRAPRAAYNRAGYDVEDVAYQTEEHGLEGPLGDTQRAKYMNDFDAEMETSRHTLMRVLREQEIVIKDLIFNTTTWTGSDLYTDVSAAPWDAAASDAIGHVRAAKEKVRRMTGLEPRSMAIGKVTYNNLLANTAIVGRLQYIKVATEDVIKSAMAAILGLDNIYVGDNVYNAAPEGGTIDVTDIWSDDYAMVFVEADGESMVSPGLGRTVVWEEDNSGTESAGADGLVFPATVEQYREEQTRSDIYRVRQHTDEKVFDKYFGHLLKVDA